ncbi:MAG: hypothetical protein AB7U73_07575 [Pirellulales bacterium]
MHSVANQDIVAGEVLVTGHSGPRLRYTGAIRSIIADGLHYLRNERLGTEELYDFANDPRETTDLVKHGLTGEPLERMRALANEVFGSEPAEINPLPLLDEPPGYRAGVGVVSPQPGG